ncbi:Methyltransferase domain-containing protein [Aliiruegeria lutimaris]|uniref:Methyltransferase domain-containing protein n=1 Tax=Aliiruegeria lutimaris TaxID=571298 RepID=A0A1G8URA8_9RHOB|nr:Methyltransferase domain-containing protein [Aliiruegeria lutimaris]
MDLPDASYDVITFIASLHHFDDLDGILKRCERALAPGGVLWATEYIGPDYFDYPEEHRDLARRLWRTLGPEVKKTWIPELQFPTVEQVIEADPTESIHSSEIPRAMKEAFEDVEIIPTYGTFAFILFWGLNHDALYETDIGREFAATVMDLDTALIDSGALPHYFAYLIGRKPNRINRIARRLGFVKR